MKAIYTLGILGLLSSAAWAQSTEQGARWLGIHASQLADDRTWSAYARPRSMLSFWPLQAQHQFGLSYGHNRKYTGWETGITFIQLQGQGFGRVKLNDGSQPELPFEIQGQAYMVPVLAKLGLPIRKLRIEAEAGFNLIVASSFRYDYYTPPSQGPSSLLASERYRFAGIDYLSRIGVGLSYQLPGPWVLGVKSGLLVFPGITYRTVKAFETHVSYRL